MKRLAIFLTVLIFISFLFGCKDTNVIEDSPTEKQTDVQTDNQEHNDTTEMGNANWNIPDEIETIKVPYKAVDYKANVKPYKIKEDLSNIENIQQFSGFTDEQKKLLAQNGFVVLPSKVTKPNYIYEANEYSDVPNFVTADVMLHLYHKFYEKTLLSIETEYLSKDLELLTDRMLNKSILVYEQLEDNKLKDIQKQNIAYFLVAKMLSTGKSDIDINMDQDIVEVAKMEYEYIQAAEGYDDSVLFGIELDYSQFTVRGHYTASPTLENFFRTMMWYGFTPIELIDLNTDELYYDNTLKALLMTYTVFLEYEGTNDIETWNNIYEPTGLYVGQSDDINIIDMNNLITSIFGEDVDVNSFIDGDYYDKLYQGVKELRNPEMVGKFVEKTVSKSFKFMGQRYILDGYIMQELMEPIKRPVPTGLDVMGVLGSEYSEELLFDVYQPQKQWDEYENKYNELKNEVADYSDDLWQSNLYNGWLWSIKSALKEYDEDSGVPTFMTNKAWRSKTLNAASSSYAELKHDTVLYGKMPVAEAGGPMPTYDQHYVEPNVELYNKMLWLMNYSVENLQSRGLLNETIREGTNYHIELLELLLDASLKQLNNKPLTDEEKDKLLWVGGTIEAILNEYIFGSATEGDGGFSNEKTAMIVSDVATIDNNLYLSMGTGYFDEIYVVVPVEDKLYLTRGAVYSYYEFVSDKRLTDEEWSELHGLNTIKDEYYEYFKIEEPSEQLPDQPFWVLDFKTETNNVNIELPEIDWDKLNE